MSDLCEQCGYDWLEGDAMSRQIDELKALLTRAADALERWIGDLPASDKHLVQELRKAAE